jgi:aryl-alcohol dehydrogenase-like predicted oxidoreductase
VCFDSKDAGSPDHFPLCSDSEELVGAWFKRTNLRSKYARMLFLSRLFQVPTDPSTCSRIFLATKFGIKSSANGSMSTNNSPEYVKEACAKSLSRLGTDYIDLYYW